MALYYELPVYKDTYKLILMIFEYTKDFSREYNNEQIDLDMSIFPAGIYFIKINESMVRKIVKE